MSQEQPGVEIPLTPDEVPSASTLDPSLAKSLRNIRIWLSVLTVFVVIGVAGTAMSVLTAAAGMAMFDSEMGGPTDKQLEAARKQVRQAFGDSLESSEVRLIDVSYGGTPFPYALMEGGMDSEKSIYVQYRLKGSDVTVADMPSGPFGPDALATGMLPTKGSLKSRMTIEQFLRLLKAYAAETEAPLGSVLRYDERAGFMPQETPPSATVTVGTKTYPTTELWSAVEGLLVKGDSVDMDAMMSQPRNAHIFHEDPKTGEFTYLGSEPSESMW